MPGNEVTIKTEQLINALKILSDTSSDTGQSLQKLEGIINQLSTLKLTDIRETSMLIANFNRELKSMGGGGQQLNQIKTSFLELARIMEHVNTTTAQFSAMSRMGWAEKRAASTPLADTAFLTAWKQQSEVYNQQKTIASVARKALQEAERIWQENLVYSEGISKLRDMVLRNLYGGNVGFPALPPGNVPGMPRLPALPTGNVPALLPSRVISYDRNAVYPEQQLPSQQVLNQYRNVTQPPTQLMSGAIPLQLMSGREDIDNAIKTRLNRVANAIEDEPLTFVETAAEATDNAASQRVIKNARDIRNEPTEAMKPYQQEVPMSPKVLQGLGLGATAAETLNQKLKDMGITQARVIANTTELSTGIQTLSFEAVDKATGAVRNFTTHLDRNGNVLADTQKRFRSFGSAVMRDVVEVLKWTIAITAIYTPIRKMGELLEEMKKIQLDLVDVQIVLGNSTREMNTVIEASGDIATQTSSTLEGVIEGYALAASASASVGNEIERMITTETLLKDSMILSKLAGIDQKQALDTLVGSLSQLGMGLTQGTQLLDSWVAVSKKANVSVKDMSTSFTIVGSAAEEAGLSYNELNALIGGLAQSTNLSADELGNAIRGIISAMQTDKAQQEFAKYGIATKTVSGDFRDLMVVLKEMKVMSQTGILDEKAMGALTQAGGAGARRGAQLSALVQNLDKVMTLVTVSETASGDAAQAMSLEMETLDAATTRLNNAFSMLAVTLGGEGGVLKFLTLVTNALTLAVGQVKNLVGIMRVAAPLMATFMLAKGVLGTATGAGLLNKNIPASLAKMFMPMGFAGKLAGGESLAGTRTDSKILQAFQNMAIGAQMSGLKPLARTATIGEFAAPWWAMINTPFAQMGRGGGVGAMTPSIGRAGGLPLGLGKISAGTFAGPLMMAMSNIGKPLEEGLPRAITGAIGALPGLLLGSGVWATVGSIIATGFYDKFLTFQGDIAEGWTRFLAGNPPPKPGAETLGEPKPNATFVEELNTQIKDSMNPWQNFITNVEATGNNLLSGMGFALQSNKDISELLTGVPGGGKQKVDQAAMIALYGTMEGGGPAGTLFTDEQKQMIRDMIKRWTTEQIKAGTMTGEIPMTPVQTAVQDEITKVSEYATTASAELIKQALEAIATGASGTIPAYIEVQDSATRIANTAASLIEAQQILGRSVEETLGTEIPVVGKYTPIPEYQAMAPEQAVGFVSELNEEQRQAVVSAYTEIKDLLDAIYLLNESIASQAGGATPEQLKTLELYKLQLMEISKTFPNVINAVQQASLAMSGAEKLKDVISLPQMTPEQLQKVTTEAEKMWKEYLKASGLTDDEINAYINGVKEQLLKVGEELSGISVKTPQEYLTSAAEGMGITGQMPGIEQMDVTFAQWQQMMAQYPVFVAAIQNAFKAKGIAWEPNEETTGFMGENWFDVQHIDNTIMQMLMKDLIEVEKEKGLQGMYNLPAGATFYVPVTAYEMSKATVTEMAGGGNYGGYYQTMIDWLSQIAKNTASVPSTAEEEAKALQREEMIARNSGEGAYTTTPTTTTPTPTVESPADRVMREYEGMMTPLQQQMQSFLAPQNQPAPPEQTFWEQFDSFMKGQTNTFPSIDVKDIIMGIADYFTGGYFSQEPQTSIAPSETPEVRLPQSMLNFFNQQALSTPISATNITQVPDQRPITTALNLAVDSNIVLTVDGRTLATIIKPYLYEDLLRFGTTAPTSITRSVIA